MKNFKDWQVTYPNKIYLFTTLFPPYFDIKRDPLLGNIVSPRYCPISQMVYKRLKKIQTNDQCQSKKSKR